MPDLTTPEARAAALGELEEVEDAAAIEVLRPTLMTIPSRTKCGPPHDPACSNQIRSHRHQTQTAHAVVALQGHT